MSSVSDFFQARGNEKGNVLMQLTETMSVHLQARLVTTRAPSTWRCHRSDSPRTHWTWVCSCVLKGSRWHVLRLCLSPALSLGLTGWDSVWDGGRLWLGRRSVKGGPERTHHAVQRGFWKRVSSRAQEPRSLFRWLQPEPACNKLDLHIVLRVLRKFESFYGAFNYKLINFLRSVCQDGLFQFWILQGQIHLNSKKCVMPMSLAAMPN